MNIDKKFIEEQIGCEIQDMKLEPIYKDNKCVGLNIFVEPINSIEFIDLDFNILPTGENFKD